MNIRILVTLALMFAVLKFVKIARKLYYYGSVMSENLVFCQDFEHSLYKK